MKKLHYYNPIYTTGLQVLANVVKTEHIHIVTVGKQENTFLHYWLVER